VVEVTDLNPVEKAEAAVRAAEIDTVAVQLALAAVDLAKAAAAQQQAQASARQCQHDHSKPRRSTGEWVGIACAVCVGGVGIAFASLALAILGGVGAIVVLVLRDLWRDMQRKGR
jgi:alkylation response protein AidB-like acyl-CoA dehydrogenase